MNREILRASIGKNVEITYTSSHGKTLVLHGVISIVHHTDFFIRGKFPNHRGAALCGGIWMSRNSVLSLKEQEEKYEETC